MLSAERRGLHQWPHRLDLGRLLAQLLNYERENLWWEPSTEAFWLQVLLQVVEAIRALLDFHFRTSLS